MGLLVLCCTYIILSLQFNNNIKATVTDQALSFCPDVSALSYKEKNNLTDIIIYHKNFLFIQLTNKQHGGDSEVAPMGDEAVLEMIVDEEIYLVAYYEFD
jgi:hypothetical protein